MEIPGQLWIIYNIFVTTANDSRTTHILKQIRGEGTLLPENHNVKVVYGHIKKQLETIHTNPGPRRRISATQRRKDRRWRRERRGERDNLEDKSQMFRTKKGTRGGKRKRGGDKSRKRREKRKRGKQLRKRAVERRNNSTIKIIAWNMCKMTMREQNRERMRRVVTYIKRMGGGANDGDNVAGGRRCNLDGRSGKLNRYNPLQTLCHPTKRKGPKWVAGRRTEKMDDGENHGRESRRNPSSVGVPTPQRSCWRRRGEQWEEDTALDEQTKQERSWPTGARRTTCA